MRGDDVEVRRALAAEVATTWRAWCDAVARVHLAAGMVEVARGAWSDRLVESARRQEVAASTALAAAVERAREVVGP